MLIYIIDAFNLIYKIKELKSSSNPHQDFINYIKKNNLTGSKNNRVILVFDGYRKQVSCYENFEVIFSQNKTADSVIKDLIKKIKNKSITYVVSDDREIIDYARIERIRFLSSEDFLNAKKPKKEKDINNKDINFSLQEDINKELRKIWNIE